MGGRDRKRQKGRQIQTERGRKRIEGTEIEKQRNKVIL